MWGGMGVEVRWEGIAGEWVEKPERAGRGWESRKVGGRVLGIGVVGEKEHCRGAAEA